MQPLGALFAATAELADLLQTIGRAISAISESGGSSRAITWRSFHGGEQAPPATANVSPADSRANDISPAGAHRWLGEPKAGSQLWRPAAELHEQIAQVHRGSAFERNSPLARLLERIEGTSQKTSATIIWTPVVPEPVTTWTGSRSGFDFTQRLARSLSRTQAEAAAKSVAKMPRQLWQRETIGLRENLSLPGDALPFGSIGPDIQADTRFIYPLRIGDPTHAISRWLASLDKLEGAWSNSDSDCPADVQTVEVARKSSWESNPLTEMKLVEQPFQSECDRNATVLGRFETFSAIGVRIPDSIFTAIGRSAGAVDPFWSDISKYSYRLPPAYVHIDKSCNWNPKEVRTEPSTLRNLRPSAAAIRADEFLGTRSAAPISINYAPVINASGLDEGQLLRVLERHAYELHRIISRQEGRNQRLAFT
jgi:hypothetical protein